MRRFSIYALLLIVILLISSCAGSKENHPSLIESLESFINDIENIPEMENIELIAKNELMRSYVLADSSLYRSQIQALSNHLNNEKAQIEFDPYKNPLDAIYNSYKFRPYTSDLSNDAIIAFVEESDTSETYRKEFSTALDNSSGVGAFPLADLLEGYLISSDYRKAVLTTLLIDSKCAAEHNTWVKAVCKIAENYHKNNMNKLSDRFYEFIELSINGEINEQKIFVKEKDIKGSLKRFAYGALVDHNIDESQVKLAQSYLDIGNYKKAVEIAESIKPHSKNLMSLMGAPNENPADRIYSYAVMKLIQQNMLSKAEELYEKIKNETELSFPSSCITKYKIDNKIMTSKDDFFYAAERSKNDDFALYRLIECMYENGYSEWADQIDKQYATIDIPDSCSTDEAADRIAIGKLSKVHSMMNNRLKSFNYHRYISYLARVFTEKSMNNELENLIESAENTIAQATIIKAAAKVCIDSDRKEEAVAMLKRLDKLLDEIPQNSRGAELLSGIAGLYYLSGEKIKAETLVYRAWSFIDDQDSFLIQGTKNDIIGNLASAGMYEQMKQLFRENAKEIGTIKNSNILRQILKREDYAEGLELLKLVDSREFSSLEDYISSKNKNRIEFTKEEIADIIDIADKWKFDFSIKRKVTSKN